MMRRIAIPDKPRRPDACAPPVNYTYDNDSRLTQVTDPTGTYQFTFDNMGTLTPPTAYGSGSFGLGYDALSRRTSLTRPNTVNTSYGYDNLSRLLSVTHA